MLPELAGFTPASLAAAPPKELQVVDEEISKVIRVLNDEITALADNEFPVKGHVAHHSFGGGSRSPMLAAHHKRAHGVVVDTLVDLRKDLSDFRDAVRDARRLIRDKDEEAEVDIRLVLARTENLDLGTEAYTQAQRDHKYDGADS